MAAVTFQVNVARGFQLQRYRKDLARRLYAGQDDRDQPADRDLGS
jgi:hypothetical protein